MLTNLHPQSFQSHRYTLKLYKIGGWDYCSTFNRYMLRIILLTLGRFDLCVLLNSNYGDVDALSFSLLFFVTTSSPFWKIGGNEFQADPTCQEVLYYDYTNESIFVLTEIESLYSCSNWDGWITFLGTHL